MHAKNAGLNNRAYRHIIEAQAEISPQGYRIPSFTFIIKAIGPVDSLALMISPQKIEGQRILNFEGQ